MKLYAYHDATGTQHVIHEDMLTTKGDWLISVPYQEFDTAVVDVTLYICITANTGISPSTSSTYWSQLVVVRDIPDPVVAVESFLDLSDAPSSYGAPGAPVLVSQNGSGLQFGDDFGLAEGMKYGLLCFNRFHEFEGKFVDEHIYGFDATMAGGAVSASGGVFNGTTSYASINSHLLNYEGEALSFAFHATLSHVLTDQTLFGNFETGPQGNGYRLTFTESSRRFAFEVTNADSVATERAENPTTVLAATRYHVAVAYDGVDAEVWVNGTHYQDESVASTVPTRAFEFGRDDTDVHYFNGKIENFAMWRGRKLTHEEVQQMQ